MISRRTAVLALVGLAVVGGGAFALGVVGAPSVDAVENRFAGVNDTTTLVGTNLSVTNPNPVGIDAGGLHVNYSVDIGGVRMATGQRQGISVGTGNQTLTFVTTMRNDRIPNWWASHLRNDERSVLEVHVDVRSSLLGQRFSATPVQRSIETDILSSFNSTETREVNANFPVVDDPVLYVNETAAWWGSVTAAESPMEARFVVYNPKPAPYTVTAIGYNITMNGVDVGSGETDRHYVLESESTTTVAATTALRNDRLDEWWVTHLENDQVTDLRIDFYVVVELPGGETIEVPLKELTHAETIETDIFGTGATTSDTAGDDDPEETADMDPSQTDDGTQSGVTDETTDGGLLGETTDDPPGTTGTESTETTDEGPETTDGGATTTTEDDGIL